MIFMGWAAMLLDVRGFQVHYIYIYIHIYMYTCIEINT